MTDQRAFTLIELVVSIGIISLISGVIFFNYPQFNEAVALNRAARELTLTLREAQTRAIAVAPLPDGTFPSNYGVAMSNTPDGNGQFIIFSDKDDDFKYTSNDVLIKTITFTRGVQITGFTLDDVPVSVAHLIYYRPGPQMIVSDHGGNCVAGDIGFGTGQSNTCDGKHSYGPLKIKISRSAGASQGAERIIEVWRTGQISIQ